MSTSVDDLKKVMANKTDEELYDVLHGHPDDYTADAVEAAKQEFASRNLNAPTLSTLGSVVEGQKQVEEAPLEWPLRIIAFFVSTLALGIPVLLAHRHYVEKGARRKAREWARWGISFLLRCIRTQVHAASVLELSNGRPNAKT
jgi:hypothetical protein